MLPSDPVQLLRWVAKQLEVAEFVSARMARYRRLEEHDVATLDRILNEYDAMKRREGR